jgi:thioredoxin reductase (NADPH)
MAGGVAAGGQLTTTTEVENYPGFADGISGPDLMDRMRQQSLNCGARIETATVDAVDLTSSPYNVTVAHRFLRHHRHMTKTT